MLNHTIGIYEPFDVVTRNSLFHAAAEGGLSVNEEVASLLMKQYDKLSPCVTSHSYLGLLSICIQVF